MGEVRLPAHIVNVEVVDEAYSHWVVDEAAKDPLAEQIRRPHAVGKGVAGPSGVPVLDVFGPLEEIGDPPDIALGEREHEIGEAPPEVGPDQIA